MFLTCNLTWTPYSVTISICVACKLLMEERILAMLGSVPFSGEASEAVSTIVFCKA